jgi:Spy/CpxP family protein refolding chaperone
MKAMHSITLTLAAASLLAFSVPVTSYSMSMDNSMKNHGQGHGQMSGTCSLDKMGDMMGMCMEHADKMGLSDDQMAKIKPIHHDIEKKQARYTADLKIAEIELMEIMEVKNFDLEKAGAAVKKSADIKTAHQMEMLKAMKEVHSILTEDQFKNMKKMMTMKQEKKPSKHMMKK